MDATRLKGLFMVGLPRLGGLVLLTTSLAVTPAWAETVIDTFGDTPNGLANTTQGYPTTAQTIMAPADNMLKSYRWNLAERAESGSIRFAVHAWAGDAPVGPALFETLVPWHAEGDYELTDINVSLAEGSLYGVVIDLLGYTGPSVRHISDAYAEGNGAFFYPGSVWFGTPGLDHKFRAVFGGADSVATQVAVDIQFCTDPNAFSCKKKGKLPVTVFGSASLNVDDIDPATLQLCLEDLSACTGAPAGWSVADHGDPVSDLGAAQCAMVEDPLESGVLLEQDYLNPDGHADLKVTFDAEDVKAVLGDFCGMAKRSVSQPLIVTGTTLDGAAIFSVPLPNAGIDQLVKANK